MIQPPDSWKENLAARLALSLIDGWVWLLSHRGSIETPRNKWRIHLGLCLNPVIKRIFGLGCAHG